MNHYALLSLCFPPSISPSLLLATAAGKRQHSWDRSHLSEIYPGVIFGCPRRPPAPRPIPAHPPGTGCLATLADWVSRVKKGSGTGRRNQITPIDHLHPALPLRAEATATKSKPCRRVWEGLLRTQGSWERHAGLCVVARSDIPYRTSWCDAATTHSPGRCDCSWRPAWERDRAGFTQTSTDEPSMSRKGPDLLSDIMRYGGSIWGR